MNITNTASPSLSLARWTTVGINFVLPVIFYRNLVDSFDLTKATVLWIAGSSVLVFIAASSSCIEWSRGEIRAALGFAVALVLATFTSFRPGSSVFGQYQRYGGLLTYFALLALFLLIACDFDLKWQQRSTLGLRLAAAVCASYVVVQSLDLDPWSWSSPGQNKPLFGTMGNINTSAGLLGTIAPLFLVGVLTSNSRVSRAGSTFAFALVGGAVGLNESFQGNVAGLVSVSILIASALRTSKVSHVLFTTGLATTFLASGLFVNSNADLTILLAVGLFWALVAASIPAEANSRPSLLLGTRRRVVGTVSTLLSLVGVLVMTTGGRISSEVRGGMVERAAFYRSALSLWRDRPFLGFGPETFGYLYSTHRPAWHAIGYEQNRPSSAHSVPLGLLASGGLVVFLAYVVFVGFVLRRGFVGIRDSDGSTRWIRVCVGGAFLAALVQSAVSVEHVALMMVFFTLAGLTVAYSRNNEVTSSFSRRRKTKSGESLALGMMIFVPLALLPQLSRPFRADLSVREGLEKAYQGGDLSGALDSMKNAVRLAPWDPQQLLRKVSLLQEMGDPNALAPEAIKLSEKFNCLPSVTIGAAYAVAATGDFTKASAVGRCALEHDPHSVVARQSVAELFAQMAEASLRASKVEVATEFVRDALELDSSNTRALQLQVSLSSFSD